MPSYSNGFCVASTRNGALQRVVPPSTVTCASCMASSSARLRPRRGAVDLVGEHHVAKTGPRWKRTPRRPFVDARPGDVRRHEVGRELQPPEARPRHAANDRASSVLPTPGTSSIRTCPSASRPRRMSSNASRLPTTARSTSSRIRAVRSRARRRRRGSERFQAIEHRFQLAWGTPGAWRSGGWDGPDERAPTPPAPTAVAPPPGRGSSWSPAGPAAPLRSPTATAALAVSGQPLSPDRSTIRPMRSSWLGSDVLAVGPVAAAGAARWAEAPRARRRRSPSR